MKNRNLNHHDNWATPEEYYKILDNEFNFNFDPCPLNHDLTKWNGLNVEWGTRTFCNPPYNRKSKEAFIRKAYAESLLGKTVVMLIPVSTSTKIFHEIIYPFAEIRFVKGRIPFKGINANGELNIKGKGMHDSMIVIFK